MSMFTNFLAASPEERQAMLAGLEPGQGLLGTPEQINARAAENQERLQSIPGYIPGVAGTGSIDNAWEVHSQGATPQYRITPVGNGGTANAWTGLTGDGNTLESKPGRTVHGIGWQDIHDKSPDEVIARLGWTTDPQDPNYVLGPRGVRTFQMAADQGHEGSRDVLNFIRNALPGGQRGALDAYLASGDASGLNAQDVLGAVGSGQKGFAEYHEQLDQPGFSLGNLLNPKTLLSLAAVPVTAGLGAGPLLTAAVGAGAGGLASDWDPLGIALGGAGGYVAGSGGFKNAFNNLSSGNFSGADIYNPSWNFGPSDLGGGGEWGISPEGFGWDPTTPIPNVDFSGNALAAAPAAKPWVFGGDTPVSGSQWNITPGGGWDPRTAVQNVNFNGVNANSVPLYATGNTTPAGGGAITGAGQPGDLYDVRGTGGVYTGGAVNAADHAGGLAGVAPKGSNALSSLGSGWDRRPGVPDLSPYQGGQIPGTNQQLGGGDTNRIDAGDRGFDFDQLSDLLDVPSNAGAVGGGLGDGIELYDPGADIGGDILSYQAVDESIGAPGFYESLYAGDTNALNLNSLPFSGPSTSVPGDFAEDFTQDPFAANGRVGGGRPGGVWNNILRDAPSQNIYT